MFLSMMIRSFSSHTQRKRISESSEQATREPFFFRRNVRGKRCFLEVFQLNVSLQRPQNFFEG